MSLTQINKPAFDLFTLNEIKGLVGVDADSLAEFDAEFFSWMCGAVSWVEAHTNHVMRESTWRLTLPEFPRCANYVELPIYPVQSIASIRYRDANGALQTWDAANYLLVLDDPATLFRAPGLDWPVTQACHPMAVEIDLVAGYALQTDNSYDIPGAFGLAVQSLVREHWNRRDRSIRAPREEVDEPSTEYLSGLLEPFARVSALSVSTPNTR